MPPSKVEVDRETFSIVVLGNFNPVIFQPLWFSNNNLLPLEETTAAEDVTIGRQIAFFRIGGMQIQVDPARMCLTTLESPLVPVLRDLTEGVLLLLEHTPITSMGLNLDAIFRVETNEAWHEIGHRLVPKNEWSRIFSQPGMMGVQVRGTRPDCTADAMNARVEPTPPNGIVLAMNQHYDLGKDEKSTVRERHAEALRILREDWLPFLTFARTAADEILSPQGNPS